MKVLFICKGNWLRSKMAETIYNRLTNSRDAFSVGTYVGAIDEPEGRALSDLFKNDPIFFEIMEAHGMNLRDDRTKRLQPEMLDQSDIVVSMAEEPFIPGFLRNSKKVICWNVENSGSMTIQDEYDKIEKLVRELIKKYNIGLRIFRKHSPYERVRGIGHG